MDTRDQYGNRVGRMDEYGNPIPDATAFGTHQTQGTDAFGNPVTHQPQGYGHETTAGSGLAGTHPLQRETDHRGGIGGVLHRTSSSSSSSSSEDDGMGGRRRKEKKKGVTEKIKEKIPGTQEYKQHKQATSGDKGMAEKIKEKVPGTHEHERQKVGATGGYGAHQGLGEGKGMMERIKEKVPGTHEHELHREGAYTGPSTAATTGGYGTTGTATTGYHDPEKKGFMEKIREKLPGGDAGHGH